MELEEIQVTLLPDGSVQLQVSGVTGGACLEITRELEQSLGGVLLFREMTAEAGESASLVQPVEEKKQVRRRQRKG